MLRNWNWVQIENFQRGVFAEKIWCFFAVQKTVLRDTKLQSVVKNQNVSRSTWQFFSKLNHELRQKWELRETRDYWHYFFIEYLSGSGGRSFIGELIWCHLLQNSDTYDSIQYDAKWQNGPTPRSLQSQKSPKIRWKEDCLWRNLPKWIYLHSSTRLQVSYDMSMHYFQSNSLIKLILYAKGTFWKLSSCNTFWNYWLDFDCNNTILALLRFANVSILRA